MILESYFEKHKSMEKHKSGLFCEIDSKDGLTCYTQEKEKYIWLDVRTQEEFDASHIPGCKHIPIEEIEDRLSEVGPKDAHYIVYCKSGGRSQAVCGFLAKQGYKNLTNLCGGITEWSGPTE